MPHVDIVGRAGNSRLWYAPPAGSPTRRPRNIKDVAIPRTEIDSMTPQPVHWHEGMFLRPHHFQAADRYTARLVDATAQFLQAHAWGLRRCVIDTEALGGYRFVVRELSARFRDGTLLQLPQDAPLPDFDLKPAFLGRNSVELFLAVPTWRPGQPNVATPGNTNPARYRTNTLPTDDENTGVNPQTLSYRSPAVRLLTADDDRSGYEVLPLARLEKSERAEATPQLAVGFIPPVLACDAWPGLQQKILQEIYSRLNKKIEVIAGQVTSRGISFDSHTPGDAKRVNQLANMNEGFALLSHLERGASRSGQSVHEYARQRLFELFEKQDEARLLAEAQATRRSVENLRNDVATALEVILLNTTQTEPERIRDWVNTHLRQSDDE